LNLFATHELSRAEYKTVSNKQYSGTNNHIRDITHRVQAE